MRKKIRYLIEVKPYNPLDHVPKKWLKIRNKILWIIAHKRKWDGRITCPFCGKKIYWAMEAGNYSFHIMCRTRGCVNIFEHDTDFIGR